MSKVLVFSATGSKKESSITLEKAIFGLTADHKLVSLAYQAYLANGRLGTAKTLTRAEVRGGGRKPWRQKGTGRARAGSTRLPHWRHGGVAFGNTGQENFTITMPAKMRQLALKQALSLQATDGKVVVLEEFTSKDSKVKSTVQFLGKLSLDGQLLLVVEALTPETDRATRNVAGLKVTSASYLNVFDTLNADHIIITKSALAILDTRLSAKTAVKPKAEAK